MLENGSCSMVESRSARQNPRCRSKSNSSTNTQISNLAEPSPVTQKPHNAPESSLNTVPYSDQVSHEPKAKKRQCTENNSPKKKGKRKVKSRDGDEELQNTDENNASTQQESLPTSNSINTQDISLTGLRNNCMESQEKELKSEKFDGKPPGQISCQNGIEMHQSAHRDFDQSQRRVSSKCVTASQSAARSRQPARLESYKRGRSGRITHIAISDLDADASIIDTTTNSTIQNSTTANFDSQPSLMARTKQTDRKKDEDRPPHATHPYVCGVCGKESTQSTNHRHHMTMQNGRDKGIGRGGRACQGMEPRRARSYVQTRHLRRNNEVQIEGVRTVRLRLRFGGGNVQGGE